jgi:DNA-binding transcriptional ArsR family regulator
MAGNTPARKVDATSLQGLAHPLRVLILDHLTLHGPATATLLANAIGESSGATSYHLRQLEKYGFVEEDPGRGNKRERWWRRVPGRMTMDGSELGESPATRDATRLVLSEFNRVKQARIDKWRSSYHLWPKEWADASWESSSHVKVTASELGEISKAIDEVLTEWVERTRDREGDDYVDAEIQWYSLPVGEPPEATVQ